MVFTLHESKEWKVRQSFIYGMVSVKEHQHTANLQRQKDLFSFFDPIFQSNSVKILTDQ